MVSVHTRRLFELLPDPVQRRFVRPRPVQQPDWLSDGLLRGVTGHLRECGIDEYDSGPGLMKTASVIVIDSLD